MLTKTVYGVVNQLQIPTYSANPEIMAYCKDGFTTLDLEIIDQIPNSH